MIDLFVGLIATHIHIYFHKNREKSRIPSAGLDDPDPLTAGPLRAASRVGGVKKPARKTFWLCSVRILLGGVLNPPHHELDTRKLDLTVL